jgi:hypothetical protein
VELINKEYEASYGSRNLDTVQYVAFVGLNTSSPNDAGRSVHFGYQMDYMTYDHVLFKYHCNPFYGGHDFTVSNSIWIEGRAFNDYLSQGAHCQALMSNGNNLILYNNLFIGDCGNSGCVTNNGKGNASGWLIYNNLFIDIANRPMVGSADQCGVLSNARIYSNTCTGACTVSFPLQTNVACDDQYTGSGNLIYNNLFWGAGMALPDVSAATFDYNYYDSTSTGIPAQAHGQTETIAKATLFPGYATYDYRLYSGATNAKDTGYTLGAPYNVGRAGTARPQGAGYDIGAYEYVNPTILLPFKVP